MSPKRTYRIIFHNQGKIYEIYARNVDQSGMYGFVEVEKLIFGEKTSMVVDPVEEHLKSEFLGVTRTYLPMHSIIRIDEVDKEGHGKIMQVTEGGERVTPFPVYAQPSSKKS
jgi:hypothetical protein